MSEIRWGICSAGKISQDFCKAVCTLENHKIQAIAARCKKDAQSLANQVGAETAYEGYASLAADPQVGMILRDLYNCFTFYISFYITDLSTVNR